MNEKYIFEEIQEARDTYIVNYSIYYAGNLALLNLIFIENIAKTEIIKFIRKELSVWITKYPIPTMATAFNDTDDMIYVNGCDDSSLIGWIDPQTHKLKSTWNKAEFEGKKYKTEDFKDGWNKVFLEIPYKTSAQIKMQADISAKQQAKGMRILRFGWFFWVCVIPATWIIIKPFGSEWIALFVTFYSLMKILSKAKKIWCKKTKTESPNQRKERMKEHYYYHCELNPDAFLALRAENFEREARQITQEEFNNLKKYQNDIIANRNYRKVH